MQKDQLEFDKKLAFINGIDSSVFGGSKNTEDITISSKEKMKDLCNL